MNAKQHEQTSNLSRNTSWAALLAIFTFTVVQLRAEWPHAVRPDAGMLAGVDAASNELAEGTRTGDLAQFYWDVHERYRWQRTVTQIATNGLIRLDYCLFAENRRPNAAPNLSILLFRPTNSSGQTNSVINTSFDDSKWEAALAFQRQPLHPPVPQSRRAQRALLAIEEALNGTQFFSANAERYQFRGTSNALEFVSQLPPSFPGVRETGGALLRRVRIFLELGKGHSVGCTCQPLLLVMEHTPVLFDGVLEPSRIVLARDIFAFFPLYFDGIIGWTNTWTVTNTIPRQVDLSLLLWPSGDLADRSVALPSTAVPVGFQGVWTNTPLPPPSPPGGTNRHDLGTEFGKKAAQKESKGRQLQFRLPGAGKHPVELEWLARSGAELARYLLHLERSEHAYDALNQHWAGGIGGSSSNITRIPLKNFPLGGGTISLRITDLDRKANINLGATSPELLFDGLIVLGTPFEEASRISERIEDWMDADDTPRANGAERDYYLG